jgi:NAD(P)H dehydrogenase (quinone)
MPRSLGSQEKSKHESNMKHAIVAAHPSRNSFIMTLANAYRDAVSARKQDFVFRDLYRMNFNPCLQENEIPWADDFTIHPDIAAERDALGDVTVFSFFYPLWLNAPPAMMKGYLERVFGMGFAYERGNGGNDPLLRGRKMISVTSSGAPTDWVVQSGAWQAVRTLFDAHFGAVCGLEVVDHIHFGGIVPGIRADAVARHAEALREKIAQHFGQSG